MSKRKFYQHTRAYWAAANPLPDRMAEEVMMGLYAEDGGCHGEFYIRWKDLGVREGPVPQLQVFQDAWGIFCGMPDLIDFLEKHGGQCIQPKEFCEGLVAMGFEDATPVRDMDGKTAADLNRECIESLREQRDKLDAEIAKREAMFGK